jgi:hypothetical protein
MPAKSRVDMIISPKTIEEISGLRLGLAAGFDERRIDKALQKASMETAKAMVKPVRKEAVGARGGTSGRLRRAIWANPVMKNKPGAYVGIRPGKNREDSKGAFYRYIITSGVSRVPYTINPRRGNKALNLGGGVIRSSVVRKNPIPGNPFVSRTVERNLDMAGKIFSDTLARIIQAGIPARGGIKLPKMK